MSTQTRILYPPLAPYFYNNLYSTKEELILVAPYIKEAVATKISEVLELSGVSDTVRLTIITNVDSTNLLSGSSDIAALEILLSRIPCSNLIGIGNLHAKCYVFDDERAIITSSNLTPRGLFHNLEMAVEIEDVSSVANIKAKLKDMYGSQGAAFSLDDVLRIKKSLEDFYRINADKIKEREDFLHGLKMDTETVTSRKVDLNFAEEINPAIAYIVSKKEKSDSSFTYHSSGIGRKINDVPVKNADEWEEMHELLLSVRKDKANYWPISLGTYKPSGLDIWCSAQRAAYKNHTIKDAHLKKLNEINFEFQEGKALWLRGYQTLLDYRNQFPTQWPNIREVHRNFKLGEWMEALRNARRTSVLISEYISKLDEMGFIWDGHEAHWEPTIRLLKEFRESHPDRWPKKGEKFKGYELYTWLKIMIKNQQHNQLSPAHLEDLRALGFSMEEYLSEEEDRIWYRNYEFLNDHIKETGGLPATNSSEFKVRRCALWLEKERRRMFAGHVSSAKEQLLLDLGIKPLPPHL